MAENKFIVFELADEFYGIPIEAVERILPEQPTTRLPRTPEMFLGVFDLRGETIPAIDLRIRFKFGTWEKDSNYIVVLTTQGRCALKVDGVDGIVTLEDSDIDEAAEMMKSRGDDFIVGVGKHEDRLIVLVTPNNVVPEELRGEVSAAAEKNEEQSVEAAA